MQKLRVLLVAYQCNPEWPSEPLASYYLSTGIRQRTHATLVTHIRNQPALDRIGAGRDVVYIDESGAIKRCYALAHRLTSRDETNWPLLHALSYPVYAEFNRKVFRMFAPRIARGEYDLVHALTPVLPRYPVKLVRACGATPFVLGPVNGGLPFPAGFEDVGRREFSRFYFLRALGRLLPGYAATYRGAAAVLAGSEHVRRMLRDLFPTLDHQPLLFAENGVSKEFFLPARQRHRENGRFTLLFVGRLVPGKGVDLIIEALSRIDDRRLYLDVVGDGPQRRELESLAVRRRVHDRVRFVGQVDHRETPSYYKAADAFCFPSLREFGGAVVLEAMGAALPCIVVDYGGIGEYVTPQAGFKIPPTSRDEVIESLAEKIRVLSTNQELWQNKSAGALERGAEFEWDRKVECLMRIYEGLVLQSKR